MIEHETFLPWRQTWQVFTTQKHIYENGVWVEIDHIANLEGKPKAMFRFFTDWQKLEWFCWSDGIVGWFCAIDRTNTKMQSLVKAAGGVQWQADENFLYYHKHTVAAPEPTNWKDFHKKVLEYRLAEQPVQQQEEKPCPS